MGISFMLHGAPKWDHPFSWANVPPAPPGIPALLQACVWTAETIGGACIVLGLLTPLFSLMQIVDMTVVITTVALPAGWVFVGHGLTWEIQAHLWIGAVVLLLCGPGRFSIDYLLSLRV
jgi:putative oxidoreductase